MRLSIHMSFWFFFPAVAFRFLGFVSFSRGFLGVTEVFALMTASFASAFSIVPVLFVGSMVVA